MAKEIELGGYGRGVPADEEEELGLVNKVVAADEWKDETLKIAKTFASGPTKAYGYIKKMMDRAANMSLDEALDYEVYMQEAAGRTEDYTNAVVAFREKKKAEFMGK